MKNDEYQKERNRKKQAAYMKRHPEVREQKKNYATYWRIRNKKKLIEYKGGKCERCGYDKDVLGAYDFHHLDPSEKEFGIGGWKNLNWEKLKAEVDKCILVCRNCHAEIHEEEIKEVKEAAFKTHEAWMKRKLGKMLCSHCGNEFQPKKSRNKYCCVECSREGRKKR